MYIPKIGERVTMDTVLGNFKQYRRKGVTEMRPYIKGEDLSKISVNKEDNPDRDMGMIARNPANSKDQWYVSRRYFEDNFEDAQ